MKSVRKISEAFNRIVNVLAIAAMVIIAFVMLLVCTEVVTRQFFDLPIKGSIEIASYSLVFITFLSTTWLLSRDGHVKMDFVFIRLEQRTQLLLNIITSLICFIIWVMIAWYGARITLESIQIGYRAPTELRTPMYLVLFVIPLGSFLLSIQFLRRCYSFIKNWNVPPGRE